MSDNKKSIKSEQVPQQTVPKELRFPRGSVVRLRSGGPFMTIGGYNEETFNYLVAWFDKNDHMQLAHCIEPQLVTLEECIKNEKEKTVK